MYKLCCAILLLMGGLVDSQAPFTLECDLNPEGKLDVIYTGEGDSLTIPYNSTVTANGQTEHEITVCVYDANTTASNESLRRVYNVVCRIGNTTVATLDIRNGTRSEFTTCMNPSLNVVGKEASQPFATLSIIDSDGYIVENVETRQEIRMRVQTLTEKSYQSPIIGKCWYGLTMYNAENENRTTVKPNSLFVEQGCTTKDENQLIDTDYDLFYTNGIMEKISYPFDLMKLFDTDFDYIQITCETYFCTEEQTCRAQCPPSETSYQISGSPRKMNLTTEVSVVFLRPTLEPKTRSPVLVFTKGTTETPSKEKSTLEEILPYLVIGTLAGTALILLVLVIIVVKGFIQKTRGNSFYDNNEGSKIFHTNIQPDDIYSSPSKEKQKLLDDPRIDIRPLPGYQNNQRYLENLHSDQRNGTDHPDNQTHRNHGNIAQSEQLTRQFSVTSPPKTPHGNMMSPPPAYISKSLLRSPQRSQGFVNYGYEEDRDNHYHGNRRSDHKDVQLSPVGGEVYHGNADYVYRPATTREVYEYSKPERREMRPYKTDTALLNNALREYFDNHGLLY